MLRKYIQHAAGLLQTATGLQKALEAATHSMRQLFQQENTDEEILTDDMNTFDSLNKRSCIA